MCNTQYPCNGKKKVPKGIHKGKCTTYSVHARGKMWKKICNVHSIRVRVCVSKGKQERKRQNMYARKRDVEKKVKKKGKYQGSGSKVFQPHECFLSPALSQQGEERAACD